MSSRKATHAGSWYTDSGPDLSKQLGSWLQEAEFSQGPARAIIAPHAGYRYCGACGAYAYRQITPELVKRVFILGPSHRARLSGCALTTVKKYETPLYNLDIDLQVTADLKKTGHFEWMDLSVDEKEHSIEMQLPFTAKVMENYRNQFTIVPVLVGSINSEKQIIYGRIFANYLADPQNLFIISSDFCHWGPQFHYTYIDNSFTNIYESIQHLDKMGMNAIEKLNPNEFSNYLKEYGNTICGRYGIVILLQMMQEFKKINPGRNLNLKFLKYAQSNQCLSMDDSSVSYASAALVID